MFTARALFSSCIAIAILFLAPLARAAERSCHVDYFETPVRCVTITVPRDYAVPDGPTITVTGVIVPASTARSAPDPLFIFAGGPGQAATDIVSMLGPVLSHVRSARDVVLFDIRGTGLSSPLNCSRGQGGDLAKGALLGYGAYDQMRDLATACAKELGDRARHHTSREIVEDIEAFRKVMGYEQINLWGGSFGTRIAQHYTRAHETRVRALVLDAVTPVGTSALSAGAMSPDASLEKMIIACAAQASCAAAFPDLRKDFAAFLAQAETPTIVNIVHPTTGKPTDVLIEYPVVANAVRAALYSRATTAILPYAIAEGRKKNFLPLIGILGAVGAGVQEGVAQGLQFSALCAEDWWLSDQGGQAVRTGGFMRDVYFELFNRACIAWPRDVLPQAMFTPLSSSVPALAISGGYDPVTPPSDAEQALKQFKTSLHLVMPHGFHINSTHPCVARVIGDFVKDPVAGGRDNDCAAQSLPPHFLTTPNY